MTDGTPSARPEHPWHSATLIGTRRQSRHARTLTFRLPGWTPHLPGQHLEVRLTAPDGYTARRRYSLAEPYARDRVAITVDFRPRGEVSSYLVQAMRLGDQLDVRGPFDDGFSWDPDAPGSPGRPLLLLAGDAGIVPLVTILRARARAERRPPALLVYRTRDAHSLLYRTDLDAPGEGVETRVIYDDPVPIGSGSAVRRITLDDVREPAAWQARPSAVAYVSGPDGFVDEAAAVLRERGYAGHRLRLQRFGPHVPR